MVAALGGPRRVGYRPLMTQEGRRRKPRQAWFALAIAALGALSALARAETVTVAVASNFSAPLARIGESFEASTGHELRLVSGSTGRLYAQIVNGAPYDVFLAADVERPQRLEADDQVVPGSRFTYAEGVLILWSAEPDFASIGCLAALQSTNTGRVAIANPRLAPYGRAARSFLDTRGLWPQIEDSLVTGENVAQVAQFVATRNASLGFIAKSQLLTAPLGASVCTYEIPEDSHAPIEQQAVLLARSADNSAATAFIDFLKSSAVREALEGMGYRTRRPGR